MNEAFESTLQVVVKHERGKVIEGLRQEIQGLHVALEARTTESEKSTGAG